MISGMLFNRQGEIDEIIKQLSQELKSRIHSTPFNSTITCLQILNDKNLLIGDSQGKLTLIDPIFLTSIWETPAHHSEVVQILLLSPTSSEFFTCGNDLRILHWDNLILIHEYESKSPVSAMYWDNTFLWVTNCSNFVTSIEFTAEGFENPKEFSIQDEKPVFPQFCVYQGKKTLLYTDLTSLKFRNIQEGSEILHIKAENITALCFVPGFDYIFYAEEEKFISVLKCSDKQSQSLRYSKGIWDILQVFEQRVLISGGTGNSKEGPCCKFWDIDELSNIVTIQLTHSPLILANSKFSPVFFMFTIGQQLIRVQKSEQGLINSIKAEDSVQDFYVKDSQILLACGNSLNFYNDNQLVSKIESEAKVNFLCVKNNKASWESDGKIWVLSLDSPDNHQEVVSLKYPLSLLRFGDFNNNLVYVEQVHQNSKITVTDLETESEFTIPIENKKVSEVFSIQNHVIYATDDGITFYNKASEEVSFVPTFAKNNLKLCMDLAQQQIFCAGDNEIIDKISLVWSFDKSAILTKSLSSSFSTESSKVHSSSLKLLYKSIVSIALDSNEQYLFVAKEDIVQYWNIKDELLVWKIKFPIKSNLKIRVSGKRIYFSQGPEILMFVDPSNETVSLTKQGMVKQFFGATQQIRDKFNLLGPNSSSLYFLGTISGIANKWIRTVYNRRVYQWVAFPHCVNLLHIFVHLQNQNLISKAFEAGCPFIRTSSGKTPLTLALEVKNKEVIELVLSKILEISVRHPKILASIESDLPSVNAISTPSLSKIYNASFPIVTQKGLKSYGNLINKKGVIITNHSYLIDENNFLQSKGYDTLEEISVVYRSSAFRMNFKPGSLESLKFVDSLTNCTDHEVFSTQLVKAIILYKWNQIRPFVIVYNLFYLISSIYNLYYVSFGVPFSWLGNIFMFIVNSVFLIHEFIQVFIGKKSYFKSIWNFIDIARIVFCYIFLFLKYDYFYGDSEPFDNTFEKKLYQSIVIVLVLGTLLKGLILFQLFDKTRSMIKVFVDVIKDSLAFLLILGTTTLAFTFIFMILDDDLDFFDAFTSTYSINFGSFHIDSYSSSSNKEKFSYTLLACFHLATLINPLLMINLLVSIMNDTFGRLKGNLEMEDLKALAEAITEHESVILWRKSEHEKEFIQICSQESNDESNTEKRIRKIVQLSEKVSMMKNSIIGMDNSAKNAYDLYGKKIAECRKQETEFLERISKEEANFKMFVTRSNSLN